MKNKEIERCKKCNLPRVKAPDCKECGLPLKRNSGRVRNGGRHGKPMNRFHWMQIPIEKRKQMIEVLRTQQWPFVESHKLLAEHFGVSVVATKALIVCATFYGFDDHFLHTAIRPWRTKEKTEGGVT